MKRFLKFTLITLLLILLSGVTIVIAVLLQKVDPAQKPPDFEPYSFADTLSHREYDLDSLKDINPNGY